MELKMGDNIYIKGFKSEEPEFYCWKHMNDLIGLPTRVFLIRNDTVYVTHPFLDVVPLSENCIDFEVLEDIDLGYHRELKNKLNIIKQMGAEKIPFSLLPKIFPKKINEQEEPKKSSKDEAILKLVNDFNNNEIDLEFLENFVGGLDNFISMLTKKNWLHLINPFAEGAKDIQNSLFYSFVKVNPDFVYEIALNYMNGITKVGEDYYYDADYSELADLFKTRVISEETIKNILSGEYDPYEYGGYDTEDEYEDVYDNLDHYAKSVVDEHIVNELKAMETLEFKYSNYRRRLPDLLSDIAEEQGTEEEFKLTDEVITRLMTDKESLKFLITRELDDVRSNLSSIYSTCYGDVLSSEWYDSMWSELVGEIVDSKDGEDYSYEKSVWLKDGTRGKKTAYGRRYKVTNCLKNIIKGWLEANKNKNGYNNNTIEYFGSYIGLIKDAMEYGPMDWLDVPRLDDYPDHRQLYKCMSENVESYF